MRQAHLIVWLAASAIGWGAPNASAPMPPTEAVIARLWANMDLMAFQLSGQIRTPKNTYAITLNTQGREMTYRFLDSPLQIQVQFEPGESKVFTRNKQDQPWQPVSLARHRLPVMESDITYEELGLNFFNWPRIDPAGVDNIKSLQAYTFDAYPEGVATRYFKVRFWVSAEHFVLLRVDAFDEDERIIKRVEVNGVQKIDDAWTIKELAISSYAPGSTASRSKTYIEIRSGKAERASTEVLGEESKPTFRATPKRELRPESGESTAGTTSDEEESKPESHSDSEESSISDTNQTAAAELEDKPNFRATGQPRLRDRE